MISFATLAVAVLATTTCACPYMNSQRKDLTANIVNPHHSGTQSSRRQMPTNAGSSLVPRRKLIFGSIVDLFKAIFNFILSLFGVDVRGTQETVSEAIAFARDDISDLLNNDRAAEMLRLAFHDCTGGICNGCIDASNIDNGGLDDPIEDLESIVNDYADFLTRGDIWVLASYVALERQQNGGNSVSFDLEFVGRPLCSDPANPPADNLPSAQLNTAGLIDYFANAFSLTNQETAAIMGAHTLYVATDETNDSFLGSSLSFAVAGLCCKTLALMVVDTVFVQEEQINANRPFPNQFLWREGNDDEFMLNADMAIVVDFGEDIDAETGEVTCSLGGTGGNVCSPSVLLEHAVDFANSDGLWRQVFHDAFMKVTNIGCSGGVCTAV